MLTSKSVASILKYAPLFYLLLSAGCLGPPQETPNQPDQPLFTEIKTKDTYFHAPTGMQFPAQLAKFERTKILQYDSNGSNISVGYSLKSLGSKIAELTVYIYPVEIDPVAGPLTLEKHYDQTRALLFNLYTDAYDLEDGEIKIGQPFGPQRGLVFRFTHRPPELFKSRLCYSRLYLFEHGPWFIKYRLTNPVKNDLKVQNEMGKFLQLLTWPELTAAEPNQPIASPPDSNF